MTAFTGTAAVHDKTTGAVVRVSVPFSVRRMYGTNAHVLSTVTPSLTGITAVKMFVYNMGVPTSWPGTPQQPAPAGAHTLVCFLPPPADLLAGRLDAQLRAWLTGAPRGTWVTAWQEANDRSNPFWAQPGVTGPATLASVHAYLRDFCAANAPHIVYGQDFGSYPVYTQGQDCTTYTCPALGFYSFDGYDRPAQDPSGRWVSPYTAAQVFAGLGQIKDRWPAATVAITETNTQRVTEDPASAGQWFQAVYQVAQQYHCVLFCTWWGPPGTTNTDWQKIEFTATAPYVATLNQIATDCSA